MRMDHEEPLTGDDRETLTNMLLPLFEEAGLKNDNVSREMIRLEVGKFFPWPHIAEVLKELEELDYISLLSTRGGGLYIPGENFYLWAESLAPAPETEAAGPDGGAAEELVLSREQAEALAALIRDLAAPAPGQEALRRARAALAENSAADFLRRLAE